MWAQARAACTGWAGRELREPAALVTGFSWSLQECLRGCECPGGCRVPHRDPHHLVPELPRLDAAHTKVSTSSVSFLVASWALSRGALVQGPTGQAESSEGASCLRSQSQRRTCPLGGLSPGAGRAWQGRMPALHFVQTAVLPASREQLGQGVACAWGAGALTWSCLMCKQ